MNCIQTSSLKLYSILDKKSIIPQKTIALNPTVVSSGGDGRD